jgi:uncharacterized protein
MSAPGSALYVGEVTHRRLRPRRHWLRYRTYALLLDLEELDEFDRRLRLFSHNSFNLFSFFDRDHGSGGGPLREQVEGRARAAGQRLEGGRILLLTMPRVLGYAFNPLSVYFCYGRDGALAAILYEVNNTFGERHGYFIPVAPGVDGVVRQSCAKRLFVSPFIAMEATYRFTVAPPARELSIAIVERDADGALLVATQRQSRRELTDAALARVFFSHPLLTLKVIAGIHFEALRLWLKGVRPQARPPQPDERVTLVARRRQP